MTPETRRAPSDAYETLLPEWSDKDRAGRANTSVLPGWPRWCRCSKRGLQIVAREADNFVLLAYPGLIVKDSYWR